MSAQNTFQKSTEPSRNKKLNNMMTVPANDGMSSQTKISTNFEGFDSTNYKVNKMDQNLMTIQDQKRTSEMRDQNDSMLPPIEMGNQWKNKLMSVP